MPGARHQVLIVDDDPDLLALLSLIMEQLAGGRWQIHVAADAAAAQGLMEKQPVDLALVDVQLPGQDGIQFIRQARQRFSRTLFVAMSGDAEPGREQACLENGAALFLEKPRSGDGWKTVYAILEESLRLADENHAGN